MRALALALLASLGAATAIGCVDGEPSPGCVDEGCATASSSSGGVEPCPAGTRADATGACNEVGWHACGARFVPDPSGWDCAPPAPGDTCEGAACAPLGWTECPAGFELDASGWGCSAIVPALPCPEGTRATIGATDCQPIGDCAAELPLAATLFVDDDYGPGEIDATHFATIAAAVAAAPPGAVIAIEAGIYSEPLLLDTSITLHGRCAEQVILDGGGSDSPGLDVRGEVTARGITVRGFSPGVWAQFGGELTLADAAMVENATAGVLVSDPGSTAQVSGTVLARNQAKGSSFGQGAAVGFGAELVVTDCAIDDNHEHGVLVTGAGSRAEVTRTVIQRTLPRQSTGALGQGIGVEDAGELVLSESAILDNHAAGVTAFSRGSTAAITRTEVARAVFGKQGDEKVGVGVTAEEGAELSVVEATIRDNGQHGLRARLGSRLTADRVSLLGNGTAGLWVLSDGTESKVVASVVRGTVVSDVAGSDAASGILVGKGATLELEDVLVEDNAGSGIFIADTGTVVHARRVLARASSPLAAGDYGYGISAEYGGTLELADSAAVGNASTALQVSDASTVVTLGAVSLRASRPNAEGRRGRGLNVQFGATLSGSGVAVVDNRQLGLFVFGQGTSVTLEETLVQGTAADSAGYGHAAMVVGASRADLHRVTLQSSAGIGLAVSSSTATLTESLVLDNAIGVHVQDGSQLAELAILPPSVPALQLAITTDVTFAGNATRVGEGVVPLPEPLASPDVR